MKVRRKILEDKMSVIPNRIMLSEVQEVHVRLFFMVVLWKIISLPNMIC